LAPTSPRRNAQVILSVGGTALVLGGLYYFFVHRHLKQKPEVSR